jgi:hypothetical protein
MISTKAIIAGEGVPPRLVMKPYGRGPRRLDRQDGEKPLLKLPLDLARDRCGDRGTGEHDTLSCMEGLDENARMEALLDLVDHAERRSVLGRPASVREG